MITINGLFDTESDAESAIIDLKEAGFHPDAISSISPQQLGSNDIEADLTAEGATTGATLGGTVGGIGGLLTGVGLIAIPGVGPVVAAGWLAAALAGVAAGAVTGGAVGGVIGSLTDSGFSETDANLYAESIRRGSTLVSVRAEPEEAETVRTILRQNQSVNPAERRKTYKEEGWLKFDSTHPPLTDDERRAEYERRYPII